MRILDIYLPIVVRPAVAPRERAVGRLRASLVWEIIQPVGWEKPSLAQNKGTSRVVVIWSSRGKAGSGLRMADSWKLT